MLIVPTSMFLAAGSGGGIRIGVASLVVGPPTAHWGYVLDGGRWDTVEGYSGGTLSETLVDGFVTDAVINTSGGNLIIWIQGDCTAEIAGFTGLVVDGIEYPFEGTGYNGGDDYTYMISDIAGNFWTSTGTSTIELY